MATREGILCESRLEEVRVYARGAEVCRRVWSEEPLSDGAGFVLVKGLSVFAEPGSFRVSLEGGGLVTSLRSWFEVPELGSGRGPLQEEVRALEVKLATLEGELAELREERQRFDRIALDDRVMRRGREEQLNPEERVSDALAAFGLIDELLASRDASIFSLERTIRETNQELSKARVALSQATASEESSDATPTLVVGLEVSEASEEPLRFLLHYRVTEARWWPAYTIRLAAGGGNAELSLEAFVAQASGEDWGDIKLQLSTADLERRVSLPVLKSWRLGRAQPKVDRGFRAPPDGLEDLFAAYDEVMVARDKSECEKPKPAPEPDYAPPSPPMDLAVLADEIDDEVWEEEYDEPMPEGLAMPMEMARMDMPKKSAGFIGAMAGAVAAPLSKSRARVLGKEMRSEELSFGGGGGAPGRGGRGATLLPSWEPGDEWFDYDQLVLQEGGARGRLAQRARAQVVGNPLQVSAPRGGKDPQRARGVFDHVYEAQGRVEVAANGQPHRLSLAQEEVEIYESLKVVPVATLDVFRQVRLDNPFEAPLLAGPLDVFVGGALLTTSSISSVDRGGALTFGRGVEERVRVSRNVHVDESSAGLFGGTTVVRHRVEIELSSALPGEIEIEVLDRLPVTHDSEVEVDLIRSKPSHKDYDQVELGSPVYGGLRWLSKLSPGATSQILFSYQISMSSKREIIGGNRRD